MAHKNCLNCGHELTGKYCSNCGQKADTHRITFKHFVFHDLLHGLFHIDKGMLYTAKQAIVRPGKAALDYIAGKRINYYNVFYFILVLIGLNMLLIYYQNELLSKVDPERAFTKEMNEAGEQIDSIVTKYGKLFIFALIPLTALNSFIIFKRRKLNYAEHFIISGMFLLGVALIITFSSLFSFLELTRIPKGLLDFVYNSTPYLLLVYMIFGYYNAFRENYTLTGFSFCMLLFMILFAAEIFLFLLLVLGVASGWGEREVIYGF